MKLPALPAETPHKSAAATFAVLTIITVLGLHKMLGLTDEDLLKLIEAGMLLASLAFAYLRPKKAETVPMRGEVGP